MKTIKESKYKIHMSTEQRERKNKYQREYFKKLWIRMSPDQRKKYRERGYEYQRKYWKQLSPERREEYNKSMREYWKQMSPEQHEKHNKRAREYRKRWSPEQRKRYNKVKRRGARVRCKKRREVVQKYKVLRGCYICGFNKHYSALDFDHINRDTKIKNVSRLVGDTCSWKTVVAEIRKCRVLCANCHRIKTHKNKDYMNINTTEFKNENKRT
jgi:hypothetical protein